MNHDSPYTEKVEAGPAKKQPAYHEFLLGAGIRMLDGLREYLVEHANDSINSRKNNSKDVLTDGNYPDNCDLGSDNRNTVKQDPSDAA